MVDMKRLVDRLEQDYNIQKKEEIQSIYEKIATDIEGASIENVLAAIKLVESIILMKRIKEIYPDLV